MRYPKSYPSFFNFILNIFGYHAVKLLKSWIYLNKQLIKVIARNKYLNNCKRSKVYPKHLNNIWSFNITFFNNIIKQRQRTYTDRYLKNMLNLEISDNCKKRRFLISRIYSVTRTIEKNLPIPICYRFFNSQNRSLHRLFLLEKDRLHKKLTLLKSSTINNDKMFDNIHDIRCRGSVWHHKGKNDYTFTFNRQAPLSGDSIYDVELKPSDYKYDTQKDLLEPREKWVS